ncbi:MAG TPA: MFS transporter [Coriobacteriia bacterium]|nr:MFS transporter [Coriobacteriia bacterium]
MAGNRMDVKERSWVMYDVANSAFVMFSTTVVPIYFTGLTTGSAVVEWGFAETIAALIVAVLMPFLGSLADYRGNKKKFLIGSVGTGVVACAALGIPTEALPFLIIYIIAAIGLNSSTVFYDAFLVDATKSEKYDSVSAKGYAWGYVGSLIPFALCLGLIYGLGDGQASALGTQLSFPVVAIWWAVFTIPLVRNVHQVNCKDKEEHALRKSFIGLGHTVKMIVKNKKLLLFMIAFFFYIDGVHTIIKMATVFGTDLGIDSMQLIAALVVTQLVAFPAALTFGKLAKTVGTRKMLIVGVIAYTLITLYAAFFLVSEVEFWVLAICVGLFQGGIQALSRSYFGSLIPKNNANEYFGFFDIFGKYAAVLGTALMSGFTLLTGNANLGILSITGLFIVGLVFLLLMPKDEDPER